MQRLNPEEYSDESIAEYRNHVDRLSQISHRETLFAGHCKNLAWFLRHHTKTEREIPDGFTWLYNASNRFSVGQRFDRGLLRCADAESQGQLLFMCGYPSADLLMRIGHHYEINPEFFDRHLSFVGKDGSTCDIHPSYHVLPSQQQHIFQTTFVTIGGVNEYTKYPTIALKRKDFAKQMRNYLHSLKKLGQQWRTFHSIVRRVEVHDSQRFSLEQGVTLLIKRCKENSNKWIAVVWLDSGDDLSRSPYGPWSYPLNLHNRHFRPVTLYHHDLASSQRIIRTDSLDAGGPRQLQQSISLLCRAYGESLDPSLMASHPLYALSEFFSFIAASEAQYLDMITSVIDDSILHMQTISSLDYSETRSVLVSSHRGLDRRHSQVTSTIEFIKTNKESSQPEVTRTISLVLQDYEYLLNRIDKLMSRCNHELTILMGTIGEEDARRSRDERKNSHKFTILATVYVPLSFSCAFFGMNFVEIDTLKHGVAIWALVTVPLFFLSLSVLIWDREYVAQLKDRIFILWRREGVDEL